MEEVPEVFGTKTPFAEKVEPGTVERKLHAKTKKKQEELKMDEEFEQFGENWNPEKVGDSIRGIVTPSEDYQGEFGPVPRVFVGEKRVFCGAGLRDLPKLEGRYVIVTYEGKQPSTKKGHADFKKFTILVKRED